MEKLVVVRRGGGHGACGEEATEKRVVGAEWWSWGLRRGTEKFLRRLAQED